MELQITITPVSFAVASVLSALFGALYAWLLNGRLRWLADEATEVSVVIGVAITLVVSALLLPLVVVAVLFWLFGMSGIWLIVRSAYNRQAERMARTARSLATIQRAKEQVHDAT